MNMFSVTKGGLGWHGVDISYERAEMGVKVYSFWWHRHDIKCLLTQASFWSHT